MSLEKVKFSLKHNLSLPNQASTTPMRVSPLVDQLYCFNTYLLPIAMEAVGPAKAGPYVGPAQSDGPVGPTARDPAR